MGYARRATVDITFNGAAVSDKLESFSYTDSADGESDRISIQVNNVDGKWTGAWMPSKGSVLVPTIHFDGQNLSCGAHILDSFSASGGSSSTCSIGAVSVPADEGFRATNRTKTWEKVTLAQIGAEVADRAGVAFSFHADDIFINSREQNEEPDCSFLNKIATTYGYIMKAYNNKIVVFDPKRYERLAPVKTLTPADLSSWSYQTQLDGTYTGAKIAYTNSGTGETIDVQIGSGNRILSLNEKADSIGDAELIAKGKLAAENRKIETVSLSKMMDLRLVSGCPIQLSGFGRIDGKYMILKADHSIGNGATTSVEAYKIDGT